jgi:hypothetical protein
MSRNGSGVYSLPAGNPVVTGTTISSSWANTTLSDIATALTGSVAADGQTAMTGNLQMGNNKVTGLAVATSSGDALSYGQAATISALTVTGAFAANGGATLGDASGDALTINSSAVSIPNGLNFDSNTFVIDATNDRVGVGTASPAQKLHVASAGTVAIRVQNTASNGSAATNYINTTTTCNVGVDGVGGYIETLGAYATVFYTNSVQRMIIDSSGNVGIGTSSPQAKLHVSGTTTRPIIQATNTNGNADIKYQSTNRTYVVGVNTGGAAGEFAFYDDTAGAERMRLDTSGNLQVGSSGFNTRIGAFVDGGADRGIFQAAVVGVTNGFYINYINGSGLVAVRFSGIATTAAAANAHLDSGDDNRLYRSTSSIQYKTNVENIAKENSDSVLNLRPVWYRSLASEDKKDWSWYGLIAEEVAEIEPRLVHWSYPDSDYDVTNENGKINRTLKSNAKLVPDGVQYERVSVLLLDVVKRQEEAIQEQQAIINDLKARIETLEAK